MSGQLTGQLRVAAVLLLLAPAATLKSQGLPVHDSLTFAKTIELVRVTREKLEAERRIFEVLQKLNLGLPAGTLGAITRRTGRTTDEPHDTQRYLYGSGFLDALNGKAGTAAGLAFTDAAIDRVLVPMPSLVDSSRALAQLPPAAQEQLRLRLVDAEVGDAVLRAAVQRRAAARQASQASEAAMTKWEQELVRSDTTRGASGALDMLSGAELIRLRQQAEQQRLTATMVELLLLQTKHQRDSDAQAANLWIANSLGWRERSAATTQGASEALRRRQP